MPAGQSSGTGAMTELDDETVRKDTILSNRDKAQRLPGRSLDGKGVQIDEYMDNPANHRPSRAKDSPSDVTTADDDLSRPPQKVAKPEASGEFEAVDRGGFDLGGSTGETEAGNGLGLGTDAMENRKGWGLPT